MNSLLQSSLAQAANSSGNQGLEIFTNILIGVGVVVAIAMITLIFFTGKGDAMSGGSSSVRTTFKGKSSFDDQMYNLVLYMGLGFMALLVVSDVLLSQINK